MNKKQIIWIGVAVIVIFVLSSVLIAYATSWSDPISESFKQLYPSVIIDGRLVPIDESDEFVGLVQRMDSTVSANTAFQTFIDHQKSQSLLKKFDLKIASDDVSDELNFYRKGSSGSLDTLIQTYFDNSEELFTQNVVYPEVVESKLRIKYNFDFNLNNDAYQKATNIIGRLKAGEKFEDLARQLSDDKQSAQFGGDLGFFEHGSILPELEEKIVVAKMGENSDIIVTRDGYVIALLVETGIQDGKKMWHAKQILVRTNGFEQWLTNQAKNVSVKVLKKY